jgi:2-iminobutanoate/2-iminopropanoate deaminase
MTKKAISAPWALAGVPYSAGMRVGDFIFVSGQVGATDNNGKEVKGIEAQTRMVLERVKGVLEMEGASLKDAVKTVVFLTDAADFAKMNEVYRGYFSSDPPARSTVVVAALAKPEMIVEIECIAYRP